MIREELEDPGLRCASECGGVLARGPNGLVQECQKLLGLMGGGEVDSADSKDARIAVTIAETSATERLALFTRAFGLTAREIELLGHLATGNDTREVARRMYLSEHTVQDHLKSIFSKTSTRSRRTLLPRALGT